MEPNGDNSIGDVDVSPPPAPPDTPTPPESHQQAPSAELEALRASVASAMAERDAALAVAAAATQEMNAQVDAALTRVNATETALAETHRRALLAEHRGSVIDELVIGSTPADLDASIEIAKAAYTRVAEVIRAERPALAIVPAGASPRAEPDAESLSPIQKLTMALGRNGGA